MKNEVTHSGSRRCCSGWIPCLVFALIFILFTLLVRFVDVGDIGVEGSSVGFSRLNGAFFDLTGVREGWYLLTEAAGYAAVALAAAFGVYGLISLIRTKRLRDVDPAIRMLGILYLALAFFYVLFTFVAVNYRPILEDGAPEASYPSSHTILSLCVYISAAMLAKRRIGNVGIRTAAQVVISVLAVLTVVGRAVCGYHWLTDIIGGLLLSAALLFFYRALLLRFGGNGAAQTGKDPDISKENEDMTE